MTDRELMQQALFWIKGVTLPATNELAEKISARLAEPPCKTGSQCVGGKCERCAEQEPMACIVKGCSNHRHKGKFVGDLCSPCATFITTGEGKYSQAYRNSQREWQGLTDEELLDIADMAYANDLELLQTLQAKLKEKNNG